MPTRTISLLFAVLAIVLGMACLIVSQESAAASRNQRRSRVLGEERKQYMATGFCPHCGDAHWLAEVGAPKPCGVCNPRGTLEVRD